MNQGVFTEDPLSQYGSQLGGGEPKIADPFFVGRGPLPGQNKEIMCFYFEGD